MITIPMVVTADGTAIDVSITNGSNVSVSVAAANATIQAAVASNGGTVPISATSANALIPCSVNGVVTVLPQPYTGEYEITPTNEEQILRTESMNMARDVVVHSIPNNYGLITWNGATLTVS